MAEAALCRVYRRRWLMLFIFLLTSAVNALHWMQYAIIANIFQRYYSVSALAIEWTSMIYMVSYIPLVFPASWLLQMKGLRVCLLLGSSIMAFGSWIKLFSGSPDRFWVAFVGQTFVAVAQIFTLALPPRLAEVWFGPDQVSTACSLGVFGNQLGIAFGFLLPPMIVSNTPDLEEMGHQIQILNYIMAAGPTAVLILIIFFFQAAPPKPPSMAQANLLQEIDVAPMSYIQSLKKMFTNRNYCLLLLANGINVGAFYAVSTLLNPFILEHFQDAEEDAGRIGLIMVLAGVVASVLGGIILDKTHMFKTVSLVVYFLGGISVLVFAIILFLEDIVLVYLVCASIGFFMSGYIAVGYEFAAELTYPISAGTSTSVINAATESFGAIFTLIAGYSLQNYNDWVTNLGICASLCVGFLFCTLIDGSKLKRLAASQSDAPTNLEQLESLQNNSRV